MLPTVINRDRHGARPALASVIARRRVAETSADVRSRTQSVRSSTSGEFGAAPDSTAEDFVPSTGGLSSVSFKSAMSIVTLRAVVVGWLVGGLVSAMNIRHGRVRIIF